LGPEPGKVGQAVLICGTDRAFTRGLTGPTWTDLPCTVRTVLCLS